MFSINCKQLSINIIIYKVTWFFNANYCSVHFYVGDFQYSICTSMNNGVVMKLDLEPLFDTSRAVDGDNETVFNETPLFYNKNLHVGVFVTFLVALYNCFSVSSKCFIVLEFCF